MKKLFLLLSIFCISFAAHAVDEEFGVGEAEEEESTDVTISYEGVVYTICEDNTLSVEQDYNESATGDIVIPATIDYNGVTYTVTTIGTYALRETEVTSVVFPETITSWGTGILYKAESLTSVSLPSNMTSIPTSMFRGCSSLTYIEVPEGVTTLESQSLSQTGLEELVLPSTLTTLESYALYTLRSWTKVTCYAKEVPTCTKYTFYSSTQKVTLYVPAASVEAYKADTYWSAAFNNIEAIDEDATEGDDDEANTDDEEQEDEDDAADTDIQVIITPADGDTVESIDRVTFACAAGLVCNSVWSDITLSLGDEQIAYAYTRKRTWDTDDETCLSCAFVFSSTATADGTYTVYIPEAAMTFGGSVDNEEMTLTYTIGTTGMQLQTVQNGGNEIYNLAGQRVNAKNAKGIVIVNGKKLLIK